MHELVQRVGATQDEREDGDVGEGIHLTIHRRGSLDALALGVVIVREDVVPIFHLRVVHLPRPHDDRRMQDVDPVAQTPKPRDERVGQKPPDVAVRLAQPEHLGAKGPSEHPQTREERSFVVKALVVVVQHSIDTFVGIDL